MEPHAFSEGTRRLAMAVLMLTHLQIASFIIGGITLGVGAHFFSLFHAQLRQRLERLARGLAFATVLVYGTGAVLAIVFVWVIALMWPPFWFHIMRVTFWPMVLEAITFALTIAFLFPYWYAWKPLSQYRGVHLSLGVATVAVVHLQQAMIDVMAGYMLTPVPAQDILRVFLNPTAVPLDVHRTVGNVSFAGFVLAAFAALRSLRAREDPERLAFWDWLGGFGLAAGLGFLFLQPAVGLFYVNELRWHAPGAFNVMMRGGNSWIFLGQAFLLSLLFFLGMLYLERRSRGIDHAGATWLRVLLVVNALGGLLLVQPYVIGPSQYTLWQRWVNPIGAMQPYKYIALAMQTLSALAALLVYLGPGLRARRLARGVEAGRGAHWTLLALGALASLMMAVMGYIRENSRRPFLINYQQRIDSPMRMPPHPPFRPRSRPSERGAGQGGQP